MKWLTLTLIFFLTTLNFVFAKPFERFVGLGYRCRTKMHINCHLNTRFFGLYSRYFDSKEFGGGQLFDWVVINDYNKLIEAIENDLIDLFEFEDLIVQNNYKVYNTKYMIHWSHLFTRNQDNSLSDDIIELEYDIRKQRIDYLSTKFKNLRQFRTLYIFSILDGKFVIDTLILQRLYTALKNFRGNDNFAILYCPIKKEFEDFSSIYVREVPFPATSIPSEEELAYWNEMLSEFPYSLTSGDSDKSNLDNSWISYCPL